MRIAPSTILLRLNLVATKDWDVRANMHCDKHDYALTFADYDSTIEYDRNYASARDDRCLTQTMLAASARRWLIASGP